MKTLCLFLFVAGHLLICLFSSMGYQLLWPVIALLLVVIIAWRIHGIRQGRWLICAALALLLGFLHALFFADRLIKGRHALERASNPLPITVSIDDVIRYHEKSIQLLVHSQAYPQGHIRIQWQQRIPLSIQKGEVWQFTIRHRLPRHVLNFHARDRELADFKSAIIGIATILPNQPIQKLNNSNSVMISFRQKTLRWLQSHLSTTHSATFAAMLLGETSLLTGDMRSLFQLTGTAHLLAISGLHVAIFYQVVSRVVAIFNLAPMYQYLIGLSAATLFGMMTGLGLPVQRALLMLWMYYGAKLLGISMGSSLRILMLSAVMIIIFDPFAYLSMSFYLSFLAVVLLIYVDQTRLIKTKPFVHTLYTQWIVSIGMIPLNIFFFQQVPLSSVFINIIAIPLASYWIMPALFAATSLHYLPLSDWLATILLQVASAGLHCLLMLFGFIVHYPWLVADYDVVNIFVLLIALLALLPFHFPYRQLMLLVGGFGAWIIQNGIFINPPLLAMTVFDVGQGLSILIRTAHHHLLFDAGPGFQGKSRIAREQIIPELHRLHIKKLDKIIISHHDADHIGGLPTLLAYFPNTYIESSSPISYVNTTLCDRGATWEWDNVKFEYLSPVQLDKSTYHSRNDDSCVLSIKYGFHHWILTGDISRRVEIGLVEIFKDKLRAELLVVPHHGSLTSSSHTFIQAVEPQFAVISSGYANRYGLPHPRILARYDAYQAKILDTERTGAIEIVLMTTQGVIMNTARNLRSHLWGY